MFVSDNVILSDIAGLLKLQAGAPALPSYWPTIVSLTHQQAYDDIVAALLARGYAPADVATWGAGAGQFYERKLALFHAANEGGGFSGVSDKFIMSLDVRKQLETLQLMDGNNKPILTTAGQVGTVGVGPMDNSSVFRWDSDGSWRGEW
jgi:hypothetical protein